MRNVLLIASKPSQTGGVNIWTGIVLDYFNKHKEVVNVSLLDDERSVLPMDNVNKLMWIYYALKDYLKVFYKLIKSVNSGNVDIVHVVSSGMAGILRDWLYVNYLYRKNIKTIVHYHCGTLPDTLARNGVLAKLLKNINSKCTFIVLDELSKATLNNGNFKNVIKIGNSYNKQIDSIEDFVRDPRKLIFVGQLVYTKGVKELLLAIKDIDGITLDCYGIENPEVKAEMLKIVEEYKMHDVVRFWGKQPPAEVFKGMKSSGLFVLPTYSEGFPFVIVEAMACGCPIITTPVGAIEEMVEYEGSEQAYLVSPKDIDSLRGQIEYCLTHYDEAVGKARHAKEKALACYSTDAVMKQLEHAWESL